MPAPLRYVRRVLQPNETVVHAARLHWLVYVPAAVWLCLSTGLAVAALSSTAARPNLALAMWIAAVLLLLLALSAAWRAFLRRATTEFAITNYRVIYKTGFFRRHTLEMNRGKVESVDVDQTILGRIFGYGTIVVRGTGGSLEPIRDIADPLRFRGHLTAAP